MVTRVIWGLAVVLMAGCAGATEQGELTLDEELEELEELDELEAQRAAVEEAVGQLCEADGDCPERMVCRVPTDCDGPTGPGACAEQCQVGCAVNYHIVCSCDGEVVSRSAGCNYNPYAYGIARGSYSNDFGGLACDVDSPVEEQQGELTFALVVVGSGFDIYDGAVVVARSRQASQLTASRLVHEFTETATAIIEAGVFRLEMPSPIGSYGAVLLEFYIDLDSNGECDADGDVGWNGIAEFDTLAYDLQTFEAFATVTPDGIRDAGEVPEASEQMCDTWSRCASCSWQALSWQRVGEYATGDVMRIAACARFQLEPGAGGSGCESSLPECGDDGLIGNDRLAMAIGHGDIPVAESIRYGQPGETLRIELDDTTIELGAPCGVDADPACVPIPEGVAELGAVLTKLSEQQMTRGTCAVGEIVLD